VVDLAARGALAMELAAIPAREPALAIRLQRGKRHVALAEHRLGTVGVAVPRLLRRHGVRYAREVGWRAVAGTVVLVVATGPGRRAACGRLTGQVGRAAVGCRRRRRLRGAAGREREHAQSDGEPHAS